ncbi:MAG TPA: AAA family ATPase [Ornithinibacter sp.]|nr:AAA family ATPase [Ornithinibacter sp.]
MSPQLPTSPPRTVPLGEAVDAVARLATTAGGDAATARAEALALAAAVAESAPQAAADWAVAAGGGSTQDFFDAASRGRRWREAPTATLRSLADQRSPHAMAYAEALATVASAACDLGEPTMRVVGNASVAAAAQLSVVRTAPPAVELPAGLERVATAGTTPTGVTAPTEAPAPGVAPVETPAAPPRKSLDELLAELDALIGLRRVKREIHRQVALLRVEKLRLDAGLKSPTITRHLVFTGNPGTGKTTVARLVGGIYQALELLTDGTLVEVDRSELVAGYLGQTATKTADVVASASGGVLFIDEAYSLTASGPGGDQYGQESVDTLVKEMEDRRDDLVVIVAGYPAPMAAFIAANPGLASRFRTTIEFEDYTDDELVEILQHLARGADYELEPAAIERFREVLGRKARDSSFGNGRYARNALEAAIGHHAWRLRDTAAPTLQQLSLLVARDFDEEPLDEGAGSGAAASDLPPAPADQRPGVRAPDPESTP